MNDDRNTVIIPQTAPFIPPQIMPHRMTGMCIGRKILPERANIWKNWGMITPNAIRLAVIVSFLVLFTL